MYKLYNFLFLVKYLNNKYFRVIILLSSTMAFLVTLSYAYRFRENILKNNSITKETFTFSKSKKYITQDYSYVSQEPIYDNLNYIPEIIIGNDKYLYNEITDLIKEQEILIKEQEKNIKSIYYILDKINKDCTAKKSKSSDIIQ